MTYNPLSQEIMSAYIAAAINEDKPTEITTDYINSVIDEYMNGAIDDYINGAY